MNSVAKNLKTIRLKAGYTQSDLAQALHVTRQTVSSWETGRSEPDIETLTAMAEYLQTDVTALIYGPKAPPYQIMQKKYRVWCIVLGVIALGGVAAHLWLRPWLIGSAERTYNGVPLALYQTALVPLCFAAAGALLPCFLSLWTNTALKKPWRTVALILGVAAIVPALSCALQFAAWNPAPDGSGTSALRLWFPFVLQGRNGPSFWTCAMPFLCGICLFLGCNREADQIG